jgi:hypothetical protein
MKLDYEPVWLLAILLCCFSEQSLAQGDKDVEWGYGTLENCFQVIPLDSQEYTMLNIPMWFKTTGTTKDLDLLRIDVFDKNGDELSYDYRGLTDNGYTVHRYPVLFSKPGGHTTQYLDAVYMHDSLLDPKDNENRF